MKNFQWTIPIAWPTQRSFPRAAKLKRHIMLSERTAGVEEAASRSCAAHIGAGKTTLSAIGRRRS
jgi:hypothetical protein